MAPLDQLMGLLRREEIDDASFDRIITLTKALVEGADRRLIPELEAHLADFLEHGGCFGRDMIGQVLAGIAGVDALPALLRASAHDMGDDQDSFQTTISELLELDQKRARPAVLELVEATDAALRATGVWALDYVISDEDLPRLLVALNDPHAKVRCNATGGVGQLAERLPEAMDALCGALNDPDPQVRISAISALGYTGSSTAMAHISRLTDDPDEDVRRFVTANDQRSPGPHRGRAPGLYRNIRRSLIDFWDTCCAKLR